MKLKLRIWRQAGPNSRGAMAEYDIDGVSPDMSFLEMLDMLNEQLTDANQEPVAFDHDCREGICGMCGLVINGVAHGGSATTTCQLHMRSFADVNSIAELFGQAATHAPQPMHVALSNALSDSRFGAGVAWASGAEPVLEEM